MNTQVADYSLAELLQNGIIDSIVEYANIFEIDPDHALALMHVKLDVYLTLISDIDPLALKIRYVFTANEIGCKFNPCNDFTQGLTANMQLQY
jgi:hypothetical protein